MTKTLTAALALTSGLFIDADKFLPSNADGSENVYAKFLSSSDHAVVIDINGLRKALHIGPMIVTGQYNKPLKSTTVTEKVGDKDVSRPVTYADRAKNLTAPAKVSRDDKGKPTQGVYLAITEVCGSNTLTTPKYTLFVDSEDADNPIELKLDIWVYRDGAINIVTALDGFSARKGSEVSGTRLRLADNTVNNMNSVIGLIVETMRLAGIKIENSPTIVFDSYLAHVAWNNSKKPGATPMLAAVASTKSDSDTFEDPFADTENKL